MRASVGCRVGGKVLIEIRENIRKREKKRGVPDTRHIAAKLGWVRLSSVGCLPDTLHDIRIEPE